MSRRLNAIWKGGAVPGGPFRGRVHSVFVRACNLLDERGRLWGLLGPELPRMAWGVRLAAAPEPFLEILEPGMGFSCDGREMRFPDADLEVDLAHALTWRGDMLPAGGGPCSEGAWRRALAVAEAAGWPGLCVLLAPAPVPCSGLDAALRERVAIGRAGNEEAARRLSAERAVEAARLCLGLGPGLTPAGDDFVAGFLAGLRIAADGGVRAAFARAAGMKLLPHTASATGKISSTFLAHACAGSFAETLAGLAEAMRCGAPDLEMDRRVDEMLAFGATSGADALAGLLCAARPGLFEERPHEAL